MKRSYRADKPEEPGQSATALVADVGWGVAVAARFGQGGESAEDVDGRRGGGRGRRQGMTMRPCGAMPPCGAWHRMPSTPLRRYRQSRSLWTGSGGTCSPERFPQRDREGSSGGGPGQEGVAQPSRRADDPVAIAGQCGIGQACLARGEECGRLTGGDLDQRPQQAGGSGREGTQRR